ncbi:MAG: EAL domain-containing protein [Candidatus Thiodiazotropha sp. (ex Monitilora ramsayi)]|nr:EAL domain-containing protein [Candidatus Thiodiazotropha sp. (ex Monitilora ramsayi)]
MTKDRSSTVQPGKVSAPPDTTDEQARLLYMQAPVSNTTVFVIAAIFYLIISQKTDSSLVGIWVLALYLSATYRLTLWYRRNRSPLTMSPSRWMQHYIFGSALVGVSWSIIYPLIYLASDMIISISLSMLAFGIIGAAVAILSVSMPAFYVYTYPQALMLGITFLLHQNSTYNWLTIALIIYLLMITLFTRNSNRRVLNAIRLQKQNQTLIGKLSHEVDQREDMIKQRTEELEDKNSALIEEVVIRKRAEQLQSEQKNILELISLGVAPLRDILSKIIQLAEHQSKDMKGSILLLDGETLQIGAAPNLPDAYNEQIDGLPIGPANCSCGSAAYYGKRIISTDVQSDPIWKEHRALGKSFDFSSCWSEPIFDSKEKVLGTFALYHQEPVSPTPDEIHLIENMAQIASIAIERSITEKQLQQSATVFESTWEGVMITDADNRILDVNKAFEEITGFSREEVIGQTPSLLRSGRHDRDFYQEMWEALRTDGQWRGEVWNRRKNGVVYPEWLNISTIQNKRGEVVNYVAVFSDITSIKRSEEELDHLAHHDPLTDLPNRLLFNSRLEQAIKHAKRNQSIFSILFIDLDRFKNINDSLGHKAGDDLLQQLAKRIQESIRLDDTVARISGDEFVVLLEDIGSAENTAVTVEKIMAVFNTPFLLDGHEIHITASIGISLFPVNGENVTTLLRNADTAMYRAKSDGRNTYQFYTQEMTNNAFERVVIENALRMALSRNEFHLVFQPQFQLESGKLIGIETLIRWQHPELGEVSPTKFIPLAEENGLIHDIGTWVLEHACQQGRTWLDKGFDFGRIAVNVARPQLQHSDFNEKVKHILERCALPADRLELEVTESYIMQNTSSAISQLDALRSLGLHLSIDDFGTGYSSMSYLKLLPIQKLKIDRSFVHDIPTDSNDMAICEAVIALSKALGLSVIAEGVETNSQAEFLIQKGCHEAQGYLYCKPLSANELIQRFTKIH